MPDSSPVIDSALLQQGAQLSVETVLAIRKYNQEVASYTLRQWNVAKLESERKERDRRKRRADALAQRAAGSPSSTMTTGTSPSSSTATPGVGSGKVGHGLGSARTGSRPPPSDRPYHQHHHHHHHHHGPPDSDGPLMMVSRRKTDRALSGHTSTALPFGQRDSHDGRYPPNNQLHHHKAYPSSQLHEDMAVMEQQQQQQRPTHHHASVSAGPRLHMRSYQTAASISSSVHVPAAAAAAAAGSLPLDPNTAHHSFDRPATQHIESVAIGLSGNDSDKEEEGYELLDDEEPLVTPPRSWQRRPSGSTPPIPIPAARQHQHHQHYHRHHSRSQSQPYEQAYSAGQQGIGLSGSSAASSVSASASVSVHSHSPQMTSGSSRSSSSHLSRHSPPARALGFSAHLGMTSISHGAGSSGVGGVGTAPSTSVTNTSDSASSSNPTSEGSSRISSYNESTLRQSLKRDEDLVGGGKEKSGRPRPPTSSKGVSVNAVEGAIGTLRRMTISEEEESVLGPLDH